MHNRLHQVIQSHESIQSIQELKINERDTAAINLAAQNNRTDVMLFLLNKGLPLKSLDRTTIEQLPLSTKLFAACGGQQLQIGLEVDPLICDAVFFRGLWKNEQGLIDAVIKNISNKEAFLELACERKNLETSRKILNDAKKIRDEFSIPTALYWITINNMDGLGELIQLKSTLLITLHQLQQAEEFTALEKLLKHEDADLFLTNTPPVTSEEKLSENNATLYQYATKANDMILKHFNLTAVDRYALFMHAFYKKDYVAAKTILDISEDKDFQLFIKLALEKHQLDLALFLIIATSQNIINLCLLWQNEAFFPTLVKLTITEEGLLQILQKSFARTPTFPAFQLMSKLIEYKDAASLKQAIKQSWLFSAKKLIPTDSLNWNDLQYKIHLEKQIATLNSCMTALLQDVQQRVNNDHCGTKVMTVICLLSFGLSFGVGLGYYLGFSDTQSDQADYSIGFGSGIASITLACLACLIYTRANNSSYDNFKLARLKESTQTAANALFDEFSHLQNNPFSTMNLDTTLITFKTEVERLLTEKQAALQKLTTHPEESVNGHSEESFNALPEESINDDPLESKASDTQGAAFAIDIGGDDNSLPAFMESKNNRFFTVDEDKTHSINSLNADSDQTQAKLTTPLLLGSNKTS